MSSNIKTSILFLSDTHGQQISHEKLLSKAIEVVIHSGDLTEDSSLEEFRITIELLKKIDAPLKLVIAGNHDFTLDTLAFKRKIEGTVPTLDPELVARHYGAFGEARKILENEQDSGIVFLDEGHHSFTLSNGAKLSVYSSPYTPSYGAWGFQYWPEKGRDFAIEKGVHIVVSHGPPKSILDRTTAGERVGCPDLFAAVARARPRIHCFGHIHEGWCAKKVAWRPEPSEQPSHFTDIDNERSEVIDNERSEVIETLASLRISESNWREGSGELEATARYSSEGDCLLETGKHTLFVNASMQGIDGHLTQMPWLVDISLDVA